MFELIIKSSAEKEMDRLSTKFRNRIVEVLEKLRMNPRPRGCLKLKGDDELWRIRVGDYRVIYTIRDDVLIVTVVRVAHRTDAYS